MTILCATDFSPSSHLLQAAPVPVICVPQAAAPATKAIPRVSSVLLATDFSDLSDRAILPGYALLRATGGRVELCHVHESANRESGDAAAVRPRPPLDDSERARLHERLRALVPPEAEARGITTSVRVLEGVSAADAILSASLRLDVNVVALASHGRSGVKRALLGSVAEEVARRCTRPVLIIHAREP